MGSVLVRAAEYTVRFRIPRSRGGTLIHAGRLSESSLTKLTERPGSGKHRMLLVTPACGKVLPHHRWEGQPDDGEVVTCKACLRWLRAGVIGGGNA